MKIAQAVLEVLDQAKTDGSRLVLVGQLDRKLYTAANDVLVAAGGKWDRKAKAHVFAGDAAEAIEPLLLTGDYARTKQDFGQFFSPREVAERVVSLSGIQPDMTVLEPSAGHGALAILARNQHATVKCVEIDRGNCEVLAGLVSPAGIIEVRQADFLGIAAEAVFDRVVMNPPFAKQADIDHVLHAAKFLKAGGRLVSVMSLSVMFRENAKTRNFRAFVEERGGSFERLPEASFKSSGTAVNACIVCLAA